MSGTRTVRADRPVRLLRAEPRPRHDHRRGRWRQDAGAGRLFLAALPPLRHARSPTAGGVAPLTSGPAAPACGAEEAPLRFTILARSPGTEARRGRLELPRATIETPAFMPVGTVGTVKAVTQ